MESVLEKNVRREEVFAKEESDSHDEDNRPSGEKKKITPKARAFLPEIHNGLVLEFEKYHDGKQHFLLPSKIDLHRIAEKYGLQFSQVKDFFANRRSRTKKQQSHHHHHHHRYANDGDEERRGSFQQQQRRTINNNNSSSSNSESSSESAAGAADVLNLSPGVYSKLREDYETKRREFGRELNGIEMLYLCGTHILTLSE